MQRVLRRQAHSDFLSRLSGNVQRGFRLGNRQSLRVEAKLHVTHAVKAPLKPGDAWFG